MKPERSDMNAANQMFLADLNHSVRTPLNGILGFTQLLEREPLTERQLQMVQSIQQAGHCLLANLNDISRFPERDTLSLTAGSLK
jgi:signal transduction histidine kinase